MGDILGNKNVVALGTSLSRNQYCLWAQKLCDALEVTYRPQELWSRGPYRPSWWWSATDPSVKSKLHVRLIRHTRQKYLEKSLIHHEKEV